MSFDYENVGSFGSEKDAIDWAKRNGISPSDLNIRARPGSDSVDVGLRRDIERPEHLEDNHNNRDRGFF